MDEENIVKKVCSELNITQKELANIMGVNDVTVRNWSSKGNLSETTVKFLNCLVENKVLKDKLDKLKLAFKLIEEAKEQYKTTFYTNSVILNYIILDNNTNFVYNST